MNAALHAEDATSIAPAALAGIPPGDAGRLTFQLDPSAAWLRSPWPIDRVWRANQPEADPEAFVDLAGGGVMLEVRRRDGVVTFRHLQPGELTFRSALDAGTSPETT
jgi:hypothetical protein